MLTIYQVGNNPASSTYIRNKMKAIKEAGLEARHIHLPEETTSGELAKRIALDSSKAIMIQLPLPQHIDTKVLDVVSPWQDIDGLNTRSHYKPLTPCAIMRWLREREIKLQGTSVAILGRSNLVGKPLAMMMIDAGATVTICNSHTPRCKRDMVVKNAKIIISATGNIRPFSWRGVREKGGQIFIDVGINRDSEGRLCGDIPAEIRTKIEEYGSECTPVPGGVGRWTVQELVLRLKEMEGIGDE